MKERKKTKQPHQMHLIKMQVLIINVTDKLIKRKIKATNKIKTWHY